MKSAYLQIVDKLLLKRKQDKKDYRLKPVLFLSGKTHFQPIKV